VQQQASTEKDKPQGSSAIHPGSSSDAANIELDALRKSLAETVAENTHLKKELTKSGAMFHGSRTPALDSQQAFEPQEPALMAASLSSRLTPLALPQPSITSRGEDTAVQSAPLRADNKVPRSLPTAHAAQVVQNAFAEPMTKRSPTELSSNINVNKRSLLAEVQSKSSGEPSPVEPSVGRDIAATLAPTSTGEETTLQRLLRLVRDTKLEFEQTEKNDSSQGSALQTESVIQDCYVDPVVGKDLHYDAESQKPYTAELQDSKRRRSLSYNSRVDKDDTKRLRTATDYISAGSVKFPRVDKQDVLLQEHAWLGCVSRQRTGLAEKADGFDSDEDQSFSTVDAEEVLKSLDAEPSFVGTHSRVRSQIPLLEEHLLANVSLAQLSEMFGGCVSAYPGLSRKQRHDSSQEFDSIKPLFRICSYSDLEPTVSETDRKQEEIQRGYAEDLSRVGMPRSTEDDGEAKALEDELMADDGETSASSDSEEEPLEVDVASSESQSTTGAESTGSNHSHVS